MFKNVLFLPSWPLVLCVGICVKVSERVFFLSFTLLSITGIFQEIIYVGRRVDLCRSMVCTYVSQSRRCQICFSISIDTYYTIEVFVVKFRSLLL